jgi:hypothetical protein
MVLARLREQPRFQAVAPTLKFADDLSTRRAEGHNSARSSTI